MITALFTCSIVQSPKTMAADDEKKNPWVGNYCMSFFTKTRTAKVVGKNHLSVALKAQYFDWDQARGADGDYHRRAQGQSKQNWTTVLCTKYGWAENHHIVVGVPYLFNDFDLGASSNDSRGFSNIFIFEKWNLIKETNKRPGVAVDFWYYTSSGDSERKLGSDDGSYKVTTEISKAWKDFSLHFNPGYTWGEDKDADIGEINAGLFLTPHPKIWPAVEYNYCNKEEKGRSHDIVPGMVWKFAKGASFKVGVPINLHSTMNDRDEIGIVFKLFYRW